MYNETGDFFLIASILGHSIKGMAEDLKVNLPEATTEQYIDVDLEHRKGTLDKYHNALYTRPKPKNERKAKYHGRLDSR